MTFHVTSSAAVHIAEWLKRSGKVGPVRVFFKKEHGCGDRSLKIETEPTVMRSDTYVETEGLGIVVNLFDHPELNGATLDIAVNNLGKRIVVRSEQLTTCGCGLSYATEEKK